MHSPYPDHGNKGLVRAESKYSSYAHGQEQHSNQNAYSTYPAYAGPRRLPPPSCNAYYNGDPFESNSSKAGYFVDAGSLEMPFDSNHHSSYPPHYRVLPGHPHESLPYDERSPNDQECNGKSEYGDNGEEKMKRKRIQQACKNCSIKRVKCNGMSPCLTCARAGDECIYGQPKKRGPAKGTTRGGKRGALARRSSSRPPQEWPANRSLASSGSYQGSGSSSHRLGPPSPTSAVASASLLALQNQRPPPSTSLRGIRKNSATYSDLVESPSQPSPPYMPPRPNTLHPTTDAHAYPRAYEDKTGSDAPRGTYMAPINSTLPRGQRLYRGESSGITYVDDRRDGDYQANDSILTRPLRAFDHRNDHYSRHDALGRFPPLTGKFPRGNSPFSFRRESASRASPGPSKVGLLLHRGNADKHTDNGVVPWTQTFDDVGFADAALSTVYRERKRARKEAEAKELGRKMGNSTATTATPTREDDGVAIVANADRMEDDLHQFTRQSSPDHTLPEVDVSVRTQSRLFTIFWAVIALHWPILYKPAFRSIDGIRMMREEEHPLLFNAICALAASTWDAEVDDVAELTPDDSRPHGSILSKKLPQKGRKITSIELRTSFWLRAKYFLLRTDNESSLENISALVFMSLRESGAGRSSQADQYCWSACRMALDLGLHRHSDVSSSLGTSLSKVEDESRRRVWWIAYTLDKMLAAQLGRPAILRDVESDCPFPSSEGEEEHETWQTSDQDVSKLFKPQTFQVLSGHPVCAMSYMVAGAKLANICEAIVAQYNVVNAKWGSSERRVEWYDKALSLHSRLVEWEETLNPTLRWHPGEAQLPHILCQQIWSKTCMILVHRPYIGKPNQPGMPNSHTECSRAVEKICQMISTYERLFDLRKLSSIVVFCIFSATTIAIGNATAVDAQVREEGKAHLRQLMHWLSRISETWSSAAHHLHILGNLAQRTNADLHGTGLDRRVGEEEEEDSDQVNTAAAASVKQKDTALLSSQGQNINLQPANQSAIATGSNIHDLTDAKDVSIPMLQQMSTGNVTGAGQLETLNGVTNIRPVETDVMLENFWQAMPLGDDVKRWSGFTENYFENLNLSQNATTDVVDMSQPGGVRGAAMAPSLDAHAAIAGVAPIAHGQWYS